LFLRTPCKPVIMFTYLYFIKLGVLDGVPGFYFCMLRAIHEFNISAKIYEMHLAERRDKKIIDKRYCLENPLSNSLQEFSDT
jgi:hypothetical protein